jgi:hypothetical protein
MRRPSATLETLSRSPLVEAGGADTPGIERVPMVPADAKPMVFLAGRPAAQRASDARAGGVEAFLLIWLAINNDRRVFVREGTHAAIL